MSGKLSENNGPTRLLRTAGGTLAAGILFCMLITPMLSSWMNYYLQDIINTALVTDNRLIIMRMLLIGFGVWMIKHFIEFTADLLKSQLLCRVKTDLRNQMFDAILNQNTARVIEEADKTEIVSRFTNDLYVLEDRYYTNLIALPFNITSFVILGFSFFRLNSLIAGLVVLYVSAAFGMPVFLAKYLDDKSDIYLEKIGILTKKLKSIVSSVQIIKNYGAEEEMKTHFSQINHETEEARFDSEAAIIQSTHTAGLIIWFVQFISLGLGLILLTKGKMLVGTVIACRMFARDIALPIRSMVENISRMKSVHSLRQRMSDEITQYASQDNQKSDPGTTVEGNKDLSFENVEYKVNGKTIINHFTFHFKHGKKYLVIGPNGAGKSTLLALAKRCRVLTGGDIKVGDTSIKSLSGKEINKLISYIPEKTALMWDSVGNNITLRQQFTQEDLESALKNARLRIPLEREVHDISDDLSSGEKRKIELARCLLRKIPIVLFDEILSSLDQETAYEIEQMILGYEGTVIMVSHVFFGNLLREYDEILLLDQGELLVHGTYDELIRSNDQFRRFCKMYEE